MDSSKRCVACAMDLRSEATRCPHCRAVQPGAVMHRGGEGRRLLGVCLALSRQFGVDVAVLRVAFILSLVISGGAPVLVYLLLWAFTPPSAIGKAPVQRVVDWVVGPAQGTGEPKVEHHI